MVVHSLRWLTSCSPPSPGRPRGVFIAPTVVERDDQRAIGRVSPRAGQPPLTTSSSNMSNTRLVHRADDASWRSLKAVHCYPLADPYKWVVGSAEPAAHVGT